MPNGTIGPTEEHLGPTFACIDIVTGGTVVAHLGACRFPVCRPKPEYLQMGATPAASRWVSVHHRISIAGDPWYPEERPFDEAVERLFAGLARLTPVGWPR